MKQLIPYPRFILLLLVVALASCVPARKTVAIDSTGVNYVEIQKSGDTVLRQLTRAQTNDLIRRWNTATPAGPVKCICEYTLAVHLKSDSLVRFRVCSGLMKLGDDWAYTIHEKMFFNDLWQQSTPH